MTEANVIKLNWGGKETVDAIGRALEQEAELEIALPADLNHALFTRLNPRAAPSAPEMLDLTGGAELARSLSGITMLEALAAIVDRVGEKGYRVRLRSPSPLLSLVPPGRAREPLGP
jgi:hypothetical protein